jgi:hypothetical protein
MKRRRYSSYQPKILIRHRRNGKMPLTAQMNILTRAAQHRHLRIKAMPGLSRTPFRAMNPRAAKEEKVKWPANVIGYDPQVRMPKQKRIMDLRHELIEYDKMGSGLHYLKAHRYANRKQRTVSSIV